MLQTFDDMVDGSQNVLVMFYTADCGHCKVMEPEYEAVAEILTKADEVALARVDTESNPDIADRFEIDGHPIFKWFAKGTTEDDKFYYVHYTGRMGNTLLKMIGERVTGFKRELPPEKDYVPKLSAANFDEYVFDRSKHVLAYLYSPWSDRQDIKLALDKVGKVFDGETTVQLAKLAIERVQERDIADRFNLKDYPGFIFFGRDGEWERYDAGTDAASIVAFLNRKAGTMRTVDGKLTVGAGKVKEMEKFATLDVTDAVVNEATAILSTLSGTAEENGKHYVKVLERIKQKGPGYVGEELKRLQGLLDKDSISAEKKKLFMIRKDILESFQPASHDEL